MATVTISALTAVLAGDLDDTARVPVDDNDSHTRKATIAQLRTQIFSGAGVPLTCAALAATTGAFSALVTITKDQQAMLFSGAGTSFQYLRFTTTGADGILGAEDAVPGVLFTGSPAYSLGIGTLGATALVLGTNGVARLTISSAGLGAFVAADKYVIVDAAGNLHVSALGPLS